VLFSTIGGLPLFKFRSPLKFHIFSNVCEFRGRYALGLRVDLLLCLKKRSVCYSTLYIKVFPHLPFVVRPCCWIIGDASVYIH
jgi:hypothetical protein